MKRPTYLAVLVPALTFVSSCGGPGATPENCPGDVPTFEYVRASRYSPEDLGENATAPPVPDRIVPSQFGSLLIPGDAGVVHRAVASAPKFASFGILTANGVPKACDSQNPCDGAEECDDGVCTLETRYYDALPPAQETLLTQFGYKPSPNTRASFDTSGCGTTNPPDDDPCIVNVIVERCGDDGANPDTCTPVMYPTCFTVRGAPGEGL